MTAARLSADLPSLPARAPMAPEAVRALVARYDRLKADRGTWETHWQDIGRYCDPRHPEFTGTVTPGSKKTRYVYSSVAPTAVDQYSAALHSLAMGQELKWFQLSAPRGLEQQPGLLQFIEDVEDAIYAVFRSPLAGFVSNTAAAVRAAVLYGTAITEVIASPSGIPYFRTRAVADALIEEDALGRVNCVMLRRRMTAAQVAERWPNAAPEEAREALKSNRPEAIIELLDIACPRPIKGASASPLDLPIARYVVHGKSATLLEESGHTRLPFAVWRYARAEEEIYGRCPAMAALPDVKMLNQMMKTVIIGAQKAVDPPLQVPDDGYLLPVQTAPGSIVFRRPGAEHIQPLLPNGRMDVGFEIIQRIQQAIEAAFSVELLAAANNPYMTATQVIDIQERRMQALGPMVGAMQTEYLQPLISLTFDALAKAGLLPTPPEALAQLGGGFSVEYVSPLARAARAGEVSGIQEMLTLVQALAAVDPSVAMVIVPEKVIRHQAYIRGVPQSLLHTPEEVQAQRAAQAQAQQQAAQMQAAQATLDQLGAGALAASNMAGAAADLAGMPAAGAA